MKALPHLNTPAEDASLWIVRLQKGLTPDESARFEAWKAEPANARSFEAMQADWSLMNLPRQKGQAGALLALLERRRHTRRRRLRVLCGVGLAAAACLALYLTLPVPQPGAANTAKAPSVVLKPDKKFLPDGSVVELNAGADIAVDFSGPTRQVKLLRGLGIARYGVQGAVVTVTATGTSCRVCSRLVAVTMMTLPSSGSSPSTASCACPTVGRASAVLAMSAKRRGAPGRFAVDDMKFLS